MQIIWLILMFVFTKTVDLFMLAYHQCIYKLNDSLFKWHETKKSCYFKRFAFFCFEIWSMECRNFLSMKTGFLTVWQHFEMRA